MDKFSLQADQTALLIIDVQERLAAVMSQRQQVVDNCLHLIELAQLQQLPLLVTEQYPRGLGQTVPELRAALPAYQPLEKLSFDCCREPAFLEAWRRLDRPKIVITGMETHICVLQTAWGLLAAGAQVHVLADAVCSRRKSNWETGLAWLRDAGAVISCTETVLFQLLGAAGSEEFKTISRRIR